MLSTGRWGRARQDRDAGVQAPVSLSPGVLPAARAGRL